MYKSYIEFFEILIDDIKKNVVINGFFFGSFMLLSLIMLNYYFNFFLFFLLITLQTREKEKKRRERERALHYCKEREGTDYIIVSQ